jgi:beta-glucanase (GH16 family)
MINKQWRIASILLVAMMVFVSAASAQTTWNLIWSDEFTGASGSAPSSANWTYDTGGGGFGNNELETYCAPTSNTAPCTTSNKNIFLDGSGNLVIKAILNSSGQWTSGRLNTSGLHTFQYGRLEARMKLPTGAGIWPAFWMLGNNIGTVGWPTSGEQDIMEWVPQYGASTTSSTIHGPGYSGANGIGSTFTFPAGGRVDDAAYHTYGVIWSPNQIQFYRDNVNTPYFTVTPANIPAGDQWVFNQPFFVILDLAIGGDFPGPPNSATPNPATVLVDYVRYYQAAAGGGGGSLNGTHTLTPQNALGSRMDDAGAVVANSNPVIIFTANGTAAQNWVFSNSGVVPSGNYNVAVSLGAYCLDVAGAGTANGTKVQIYQCNGTNAQSWNAVLGSSGKYTLHPANAPNSCLDVTGNSTANNTQLQIWSCTGGANQSWAIN